MLKFYKSIIEKNLDEKEVERIYKTLGHQRGWRFMTCPVGNHTRSEGAIITLNPGGTEQPEPKWSMENGFSYFENEPWDECYKKSSKRFEPGKHPLQLQVQLLAKELSWDLRKIFSAQFVPFCSPRWEKLENKDKTLKFCRERLWPWALSKSPATHIVCVGKVVAREIVSLEDAIHRVSLETGWGQTTIDRFESRKVRGRFILGLPHLSRYRIFGRGAKAESALKELASVV